MEARDLLSRVLPILLTLALLGRPPRVPLDTARLKHGGSEADADPKQLLWSWAYVRMKSKISFVPTSVGASELHWPRLNALGPVGDSIHKDLAILQQHPGVPALHHLLQVNLQIAILKEDVDGWCW